MIQMYSLTVIDDEAPLLPSLEEFRENINFKPTERLLCWLSKQFVTLASRRKMLPPFHSYGSGVLYTGTAHDGIGWLVCLRCGHARKYSLVSTAYA